VASEWVYDPWLKQELARFAAAEIPTRRPNGMNRHGLILDLEVGLGRIVALYCQSSTLY
jgi:hypothetical protein